MSRCLLDLLNALLGHEVRADEPLDKLVAPLQGQVDRQTPVGRLREIFAEDNVALVMEAGRVAAVITKIDLIEFLTRVGM